MRRQEGSAAFAGHRDGHHGSVALLPVRRDEHLWHERKQLRRDGLATERNRKSVESFGAELAVGILKVRLLSTHIPQDANEISAITETSKRQHGRNADRGALHLGE